MFKYIKEHLVNADGISIYPVISLLIFFVFFIALLYYVKKMDKKKVEEISKLPLDLPEEPASAYSQNNLKKV
jgi:cytochrome c oxidase cbb3-type subunit IV